MLRHLALFTLWGALAAPASSQVVEDCVDQGDSPCSVASLVADADAVAPGTALDVALRIEIEPKWHVYWQNPGDSGLPVRVTWDAPEGVRIGPLQNPYPERLDIAGLTSYAFEDEALLFARVAVPDDLDGDAFTISGTATWLICADVCVDATEEVSLALPVGTPTETDRLAEARTRLPVQAEGWQADAAPADSGLALVLTPPDGWAGSLADAQFFPAEQGVLDHAAPQTFTRDGAAWRVDLTPSPMADGLGRIRGVLVAAEGASLVGEARAVEIDALVGAEPLAERRSAGGLLWAILLALGGGVLLNLMPCVFPILGIKVLGFTQGHDGATLRRHGLAFGAGVVVSFWIVAGGLLALRAAGEGLGWGFHLQSPPVVAALAALMVLIGLNLLGVFEVGTRLAAAGARADRREGLGGAFFSGVLATVVATPCTAPLMGPALGYAVAAPVAAALVVFTALGVGMALPYVLLSFFPTWTERLPRPGPWMETLRQALAFPMFVTAVWLLWVFGGQVGVNGTMLLLLALVLLALAAWLVGRWPSASGRMHLVPRGLAVLTVLAAVGLTILAVRAAPPDAVAAIPADGDSEATAWQPFVATDVDQLVASGQPVFVDVTATWCLTCQVNKVSALSTDRVEQAFADRGVALIRADWTSRNPEITAFLDGFGRSSIPVYVLYPGDGADPILLPEVLTPEIVLNALDPLPLLASR